MNIFQRRTILILVIAGPLVCSLVVAGTNEELIKVSSSEAERPDLGLTPMGAEQAGNADGTIPAWDGGITEPPAEYEVNSFHPDPFSEDEVLFTISAENVNQYRDKLSPGHIALLEQLPTYRLNIYKTRRTVAWPEFQYEGTKENARRARLTNDGEGVAGAISGVPFPIPKSGKEVIWNHKLRYRGGSVVRFNNQAILSSSGDYEFVRLREEYLMPLGHEGQHIDELDNSIYLYFKQVIESPAKLAGTVLLAWEGVKSETASRQAWLYNPGQRRIRRVPNMVYDNPAATADGVRTNDMHDMFNGALDLYDWSIRGKVEMYVPYNSYKLHSDRVDVKTIIGPNHINPELSRYELHRVWVVDAILQEGERHINARRTFYVDEDSWQILLVDHYDDRDQLWRVSEAHCINYYDALVFWTTLEVHYDIQAQRYVVMGLDNQDYVYNFSFDMSVSDFEPGALRRAGRR